MIPKIRFIYSSVYDSMYRNSLEIKKTLKKYGREYPPTKNVFKYTEQIENSWKKEGNKILREISKITGLKWKEKEIKCYVIGWGRCFSDPLTIRMYKNKNKFTDMNENFDLKKFSKVDKYKNKDIKLFLNGIESNLLFDEGKKVYIMNSLKKQVKYFKKIFNEDKIIG